MEETQFFTYEFIIKILLHPQVIAFFLTILLEIVRRIITPKACIIWGNRHGFNYLVPQNPNTERGKEIPNLPINTRSVFVRNKGRGPAKNVEFYFNYKPEHHEIWPIIQHTTSFAPDGRFIITFPYIKHKEFFGIEVIHSMSNAPEILNVRAEEGKCKNVNMAPVQVFPTWINFSIIGVFLLGVFQLLSILVSIILKFLGI